jgi:hypothetical protein
LVLLGSLGSRYLAAPTTINIFSSSVTNSEDLIFDPDAWYFIAPSAACLGLKN